MKKSILSLVLLAAVFSAAVSAQAQNTAIRASLSQSDVPDNMLSYSPYGDCTVQELTDGSCVKQLFEGTALVTGVDTPQGKNVIFQIVAGDCNQQVNVITPSEQHLIINGSVESDEHGDFTLVNNSMSRCQIKIQIAQ